MVGLISLVVAARPRRKRAFAALRFIASSKAAGVSPRQIAGVWRHTEFCRTGTHPPPRSLKGLPTQRHWSTRSQSHISNTFPNPRKKRNVTLLGPFHLYGRPSSA